VSSNVEFKGQWPEKEQKQFIDDMNIVEDFLSVDEENKFSEELEPYLKRMRYEFDHWDDVSKIKIFIA
jgi:alkylated DNA repair protein alkB homolog 7